MKINTKSVLNYKDRFISYLNPETLDKATFSTLTNLAKYKRTLDITEEERTEEDKKTAYSLIEKAIVDMERNGNPILVDNLLFAIAYPESYNLVKKYYNTLTYTCLNNNKFMISDGEKVSPFNNKDAAYVVSRIKQIEQTTYALFIPLFENTDFLKKDGNFDNRSIDNIVHKYKLLKVSPNENVLDQKIAYEIYCLILEEDYTLDKVIKLYNLTNERIHSILEANLTTEEYRNILKELKLNSLKYLHEINNVIEKLYNYIPNGFVLSDGRKVKFTMLDYYSITGINPSVIIDEMNRRIPKNKEEATARTICRKFLQANKNLGPFINKDILKSKKETISTNDEVFELVDYADEIIDQFREKNIPCHYGLSELAFLRIARNIPIFPLEEELKLGIAI